MTFQVGIVGTDGVLLASDSQVTHYQPGEFRTTSQGSKLFWDGGGVGCCWAGNQWAKNAVECCSSQPGASSISEHLKAGCKIALEQCSRLGCDAESAHGTVLFVHRENQKAELWFSEVRAVLDHEGLILPSSPQRVHDRKWTGDSGNAAVFFLERHPPDGPAFPVGELKLIAAHAIFMAGKLNPFGVKGLDILVCRNGTEAFEAVTDEELATLETRSNELDLGIATTLGLSSS